MTLNTAKYRDTQSFVVNCQLSIVFLFFVCCLLFVPPTTNNELNYIGCNWLHTDKTPPTGWMLSAGIFVINRFAQPIKYVN
ncbi:hypothetical protein AMR41_23260 [Hapalosiphon sp. MRB220]|nr:hypothetical protein AMR41_23260 [Hapalosiphon sp. MRB220]